jgi:hypothetical protein
VQISPEDSDGSVLELSPDALAEVINALDGVEGLEVDLRDDGSPRLRVRLDGSIASDVVGQRIREVLEEVRPFAGGARSGSERRTGLGRGLAEIIETEAAAAAPKLFDTPQEAPATRLSLALVAVEETAGGISVRAADSSGGIAFSPVEDTRSLNQAVASAVGRLRQERPLPRLAGVEIRDVDGAAVLTVVLALENGKRSVGAALVEGGMPFTLGKAVWEALASAD